MHCAPCVCFRRSYTQAPAAREPVLSSLELEEVRLDGRRYLLSRYNNLVYDIPGAQVRALSRVCCVLRVVSVPGSGMPPWTTGQGRLPGG